MSTITPRTMAILPFEEVPQLLTHKPPQLKSADLQSAVELSYTHFFRS